MTSAFGACALDRTGTEPAPPPDTTEAVGVLITPTGVVAPILATADGGGHWVRTPCYRIARVRTGRVVHHATVVVDAGHGGDESGAIGPNGLREKTVNLAVADRVVAQLAAAGTPVVATRTSDYRVTLRTRAEIATALSADALVSVHHNSAVDTPRGGPGSETFHQIVSPRSRALAEAIQAEVPRVLARFDAAWVGNADAAAHHRLGEDGDYYGVLRFSVGVPAVIVEAAYLSNAPEAALLSTGGFRDAEAGAIAAGIAEYLGRLARSGDGLDAADPVEVVTEGTTVVRKRPRAGGGAADADGCTDPRLE